MALIAGVDEAGKGCLFGSMVFGCAMYRDDGTLDRLGVNDSKKLTPKKRSMLYEKILDTAVDVQMLEFTASHLDNYHKKGITMTEMGIMGFAMILNGLSERPDVVYLDACHTNNEKFGRLVGERLKWDPLPKIVSEHKADAKFPIVGASSIVAKVERDELYKSLGYPGSGYTSDRITMDWVEDRYRKTKTFPDQTRMFWKTVENIKTKFG